MLNSNLQTIYLYLVRLLGSSAKNLPKVGLPHIKKHQNFIEKTCN